jgi:intein-encoded DNA endonuclease-like protein
VASRRGVTLRPTLEREKLYHRVLELRKEGLSYNRIIARMQAEEGVALRKSQISDWVSGKHRPFGYVRQFAPTPCPELAYILGVKWGDASTNTNRKHMHMIKLRVTDKDFAEEFSRCLSAVLKRSPPRVRWNERTRSWHVEVSSLLLQDFLKLGIKDQIPAINH